MPLTTNISGQQQYTLLARNIETGQQVVCTLGGNPILTTDHSLLMEYAVRLVNHFGKQHIYTVAMVQPITMEELGDHVARSNSSLPRQDVFEDYTGPEKQ